MSLYKIDNVALKELASYVFPIGDIVLNSELAKIIDYIEKGKLVCYSEEPFSNNTRSILFGFSPNELRGSVDFSKTSVQAKYDNGFRKFDINTYETSDSLTASSDERLYAKTTKFEEGNEDNPSKKDEVIYGSAFMKELDLIVKLQSKEIINSENKTIYQDITLKEDYADAKQFEEPYQFINITSVVEKKESTTARDKHGKSVRITNMKNNQETLMFEPISTLSTGEFLPVEIKPLSEDKKNPTNIDEVLKTIQFELSDYKVTNPTNNDKAKLGYYKALYDYAIEKPAVLE